MKNSYLHELQKKKKRDKHANLNQVNSCVFTLTESILSDHCFAFTFLVNQPACFFRSIFFQSSPPPTTSSYVPVPLSPITGVDVCLFLLCRAGSEFHMVRASPQHSSEYSSTIAGAHACALKKENKNQEKRRSTNHFLRRGRQTQQARRSRQIHPSDLCKERETKHQF